MKQLQWHRMLYAQMKTTQNDKKNKTFEMEKIDKRQHNSFFTYMVFCKIFRYAWNIWLGFVFGRKWVLCQFTHASFTNEQQALQIIIQ